MKSLQSLEARAGLIAMVVLQACGGDASGPGEGAASIAANSSTTLSAAVGAPVTEPPSVVVRNQSGQPVAGARVSFSVATGGGRVTGGNATTDASGVATVGSWTLGPTAGSNTLTATAGNLPAVTFTADGADPCTILTNHTPGSTSQGELSTFDCQLGDGTYADLYAVNVTTPGTYVFTQTAATFDTYLLLAGSSGGLLALNDDVGTDTTKSSIKAILPAASFILAANSFSPNRTGGYSVSSTLSSAHITGCEEVFTVPGVTTEQSLESSDCALNGIFGDQYVIVLIADQPVTVSMTSTAVDPYLEIHIFGDLTILASNDNADAATTNATVVFTPRESAFYIITARTQTAGMSGNYTLTIQ